VSEREGGGEREALFCTLVLESESLAHPDSSISLCFGHANISISLNSSSLGFPQGAQIFHLIIDILIEENRQDYKWV